MTNRFNRIAFIADDNRHTVRIASVADLTASFDEKPEAWGTEKFMRYLMGIGLADFDSAEDVISFMEDARWSETAQQEAIRKLVHYMPDSEIAHDEFSYAFTEAMRGLVPGYRFEADAESVSPWCAPWQWVDDMGEWWDLSKSDSENGKAWAQKVARDVRWALHEEAFNK